MWEMVSTTFYCKCGNEVYLALDQFVTCYCGRRYHFTASVKGDTTSATFTITDLYQPATDAASQVVLQVADD